jgi:hypothetical protein
MFKFKMICVSSSITVLNLKVRGLLKGSFWCGVKVGMDHGKEGKEWLARP